MSYQTTTTLEPDKAIEIARRFFAGNYELPVQQEQPGEIRFERGNGFVFVRVTGENPTTLELDTYEWRGAVQAFIDYIPK